MPNHLCLQRKIQRTTESKQRCVWLVSGRVNVWAIMYCWLYPATFGLGAVNYRSWLKSPRNVVAEKPDSCISHAKNKRIFQLLFTNLGLCTYIFPICPLIFVLLFFGISTRIVQKREPFRRDFVIYVLPGRPFFFSSNML
jgi:hypothetical protein